jgi:membrane protein YdbS with pleckstrin-like domain
MMQKPRMKAKHFSRLKTGLIIIAVLIWAYVMKGIWDLWHFANEALSAYLVRTLLIIIVVYVFLLVMELWVDYEDLD